MPERAWARAGAWAWGKTPARMFAQFPFFLPNLSHMHYLSGDNCLETNMSDVAADSAETVRLLEQVVQGDSQALDSLLARYRPRLHAFVRVRLDPRVRSRLDASDVVQEAQLRIAERVGE